MDRNLKPDMVEGKDYIALTENIAMDFFKAY